MMVFQAISTKVLPPTTHRGKRVKAITTSLLKTTLPWNYAKGDQENHIEAFKSLAKKLNWTGTFAVGYTREGYVFVGVVDTITIGVNI